MILPSSDGGTGHSGRIIGPSQQPWRLHCKLRRHTPLSPIADKPLLNQQQLLRQWPLL
jgi:hypothetical protein